MFRLNKSYRCGKIEGRVSNTMRERARERGANRGVHSCHGCMIITDSSVIEDLLTAFHYQQEMYNETEEEEGGGH